MKIKHNLPIPASPSVGQPKPFEASPFDFCSDLLMSFKLDRYFESEIDKLIKI